MVVAALANRLFPSSRGILRHTQQQQQQQLQDYAVVSQPPTMQDDNGSMYIQFADNNNNNNSYTNQPKRKRFRAVAALTSLASDLDVISDWIFYSQAVRHDQDYRAQRTAATSAGEEMNDSYSNSNSHSKPYLIPPFLLTLLLITCIAGTIMWLVLATDGRIVTPLLRRVDIEKLSMGYALLACVLIEDIPQVILTFLIEDYFESADDGISNFALANLTTSLYDTLIKLAEAYDERNDLVETGAWCKSSFMAHKNVVTAVMAVPCTVAAAAASKHDWCDETEERTITTTAKTTSRMKSSKSLRTTRMQPSSSSSSRRRRQRQQQQQSSVWSLSLRSSSPSVMPRFRFLTTSVDKSIRLWDTAVFFSDESTSTGRYDYVCKMKGHQKAITCMTLLGQQQQRVVDLVLPNEPGNLLNRDNDNNNNSTRLNEQEIMDRSTLLVTGSKDGVAKLWNLVGDCIRSYYIPPGEMTSCAMTSVAAIHQGRTFAAGYSNGMIRLWEASLGFCIATFSGHGRGNICLCALQDENTLASGSDAECSVQVWDTKEAMDSFRHRTTPQYDAENPDGSGGSLLDKAKALSESPAFEETVCKHTLIGHTAPILCIAIVAVRQAIVSGSVDGTARIWAVHQSSVCLRILSGHGGPVRCVTALDHTSILSSSGATIRMFDAITGNCLREYNGHESMVTGLSTTHDKRYFLSCSSDCTVKTWVVTSISEADQSGSKDLDDLLDLNDSLCL